MDEVIVGGEVVGEDGVAFCGFGWFYCVSSFECFKFLLAGVERKGAEVVGLAGADFNLDQSGL